MQQAYSDAKNVQIDQHNEVGRSRILIVDDNQVNRTILVEQCESWGHECIAVESGSLGLQFLKHAAQNHNLNVDLIISNFHMPEMKGADFAGAIRQNSAIASTPVLVLSSVDQSEQLNQLRDIGIDAYLPKPTRSKQLRDTVESILLKNLKNKLASDIKTDQNVATENNPTPDTIFITNAESVLANTSVNPESVISHSHELPVEEPIQQAVTEMPSQPSSSSLSILVAEDNPVNQIVFTEALKTLGYDFAIANDGQEAVEMWQEHQPQIIVMDISMPRLNGHQATQEIRKMEKEQGLRHTPIIAVTAHALKGDREKCINAGMDDYMTKPISPDMLNEKIVEWLDNNKMAEIG